jgi:hypothetical protein
LKLVLETLLEVVLESLLKIVLGTLWEVVLEIVHRTCMMCGRLGVFIGLSFVFLGFLCLYFCCM